MSGYENEYETTSEYGDYRSVNRSGSLDSIQKCKIPVSPLPKPPHSCQIQSTTWPKMRKKHKAFIMIFSALFIVVDAVFWSLTHLVKSEGSLEEMFSKSPLETINTIAGTAIFLSYIIFCCIGIYAILFKRRGLLIVFMVYLMIVAISCIPHILYHILNNDPYAKMVIVSIVMVWTLTVFFFLRLHLYYMKLCIKCY
ncbi:unnamed protein product, partial [Mesorhabditis belari]|uniref:Uncharacterized protein n=1 Tax=Mesorhabditis belari TaxID=2138241 RepID=A0AAF3ECD7_9BILA